MSFPQAEKNPIQLIKLKYLATCNDDVLSESTDPEKVIEYVDIGSVDRVSGIQNTENYTFKDAPSRARRLAQCGDIIVSTVRTYLEAIAPVDERHSKAVFSTGFAVVRPRGMHAEFAKYALRSREFISSVIIESVGVGYPAISSRSLMNLKVPVPNQTDQKVIAHFLDKEISRIDALVEEKRAFINLLKEKRQAMISHVVTKGLNPNVEMKDSGVEWIGEIPRHWDAKRIKHVAKVNPSTNRPEILPDESIGFVPMTNVNEKIGVIRKVDVRKYSEVSSGYTLFQNGDVIFAKITPCMENGNCAMIADMNYGIGFGSTEFIVFRPGKLIMQEYLHMVLRNNELRKICKRFMSGTAGQQRIATPFLENFPLALPPIEEQKAIVKEVGKKVKRLESLEDEVRKSIELLKEHRTALISAAVTGKIDLRDKEVA